MTSPTAQHARDAERYQALLDDPDTARHLLLLLLQKRGTQDDFRRMQDRIAASKERRAQQLANAGDQRDREEER